VLVVIVACTRGMLRGPSGASVLRAASVTRGPSASVSERPSRSAKLTLDRSEVKNAIWSLFFAGQLGGPSYNLIAGMPVAPCRSTQRLYVATGI